VVQGILHGRQCGGDALLARDLAVLDRHIEVDADARRPASGQSRTVQRWAVGERSRARTHRMSTRRPASSTSRMPSLPARDAMSEALF
jgi:hypothetical protein